MWVYVDYFLNDEKISSLAENTSSKVVFREVLATAARDIVTKDISRLRGGWPMQDAFYVSLPHLIVSYGVVLILCYKGFPCISDFDYYGDDLCFMPLLILFPLLFIFFYTNCFSEEANIFS